MVARVPLRLKFLILLLLGVLAVTLTTLFIVRRAVDRQVRAEIVSDLRNSVLTFRAFRREREDKLSRYAELLADLPTVKALMTTEDVATIQDASTATWRLSGSDLLALASPAGKVMAVHTKVSDITFGQTQEALTSSMGSPANQQWWFLGGHLYEVFFQPIYFGGVNENLLLGVVALGYEIDERAAQDVSQITGSQITFLYRDSVVASTLDRQGLSFARKVQVPSTPDEVLVQDLRLGVERYLASTVELTPATAPGVYLNVLKSYDYATARFRSLYRTLTALGILAFLGQGLLAFVAFRRYTRPLDRLVAGVRALGKGDFAYPLETRGGDELAEVTGSFVRMRDDLQRTQQQLLESERLATIGRMASSISHDLRHELTPILANAEFLSERKLDANQSEELYQEVRDAAGRMTDLIDSLLEFGKSPGALSRTYGNLKETMQRAIRSVQSHPSIHKVNIKLSSDGNCEGWFDSKRLERVFYNLLLNACQAAPVETGHVEVMVQSLAEAAQITITDNGPGIPDQVRPRIFEPFFSFGKENGTGLGLAIVQKLVGEHGGTVELMASYSGRTTFRVMLPFLIGRAMEVTDDHDPIASQDAVSSK